MNLPSLYLGVLGLLLSSSITINCNRVANKSGKTFLGAPGDDYPIFSAIPITAFKCDENKPGYYADVEGLCQVFHICQDDGRHDSFLCPNGTLFNQNYFVCDWWYNVDCSSSPSLYPLNEIFKQNTLSRNQASLKSAKLISPAASIKSVTSSGILPSQPETVTSTIPKQQTVTAAAAREPSLHNSAKTYPTVNNTKPSSSYPLPAANTREAFGMKIPSVNRMGGHDMPLIENLVENRPTTDSVDTSSDPEVQFESTEVPPTTIQPLEEDEIRTELSVGEQLASIPNLRKSEAPEILIEKDTIDTKTKTLINDDLYFARKKTFFPTNTYTDKPSTFELNVVKVDEAQASAAITTINAASEKDFDDYATTISSPTINQATNSLELLAITPEESTEYISVTDRTSPEIEIGDSVLANLVTSEATSTEIAQNLKPTLAPSLRDPPAIVGLYFKVLTDSSLGAGIHLNHHSNTTLLPINTEVGTPFSSTKTPAYGININFSSSTLIPAATTTPTSNIIINSTTERTLMTTTTRNSAKSDDSIATIPDKAEEKRTLYEKLKPAIVSKDVRPLAPIYGSKTAKSIISKNTKS